MPKYWVLYLHARKVSCTSLLYNVHSLVIHVRNYLHKGHTHLKMLSVISTLGKSFQSGQ